MGDIQKLLEKCQPVDENGRFTIEGGTLYFGRSDYTHGFNLGCISDLAFNTLDILNAPVDRIEALKAENQQLQAKLDAVAKWPCYLTWKGYTDTDGESETCADQYEEDDGWRHCPVCRLKTALQEKQG